MRFRASTLGSLALPFWIASILLLVLPEGIAIGPSPIVTFAAPYTGGSAGHLGLNLHQTYSCGATLKVLNRGSFNATSGDFGARLNASVAGCGSNADAFERYGFGISGLSFTVPRNGTYNLSCNWAARIHAILFSNESANGSLPDFSGVILNAFCEVVGAPRTNAYQASLLSLGMNGPGIRNVFLKDHAVTVRGLHIALYRGVMYSVSTWLQYNVAAWGASSGSLVAASLDVGPPLGSNSLVRVTIS
jgi:hypothetical protein